MSHCINIKHPDYIKLEKESGLNPILLKARISIYQDKFGMNSYPTTTEISNSSKVKSELYQKESKVGKPVDESLDSTIREFLRLVNVNIENVDSLLSSEGNSVIAKMSIESKANGLLKLIQVIQGKAKLDTLSEEAAHIMVELLGKDNPLVARMMYLIDKTDLYSSVVSEYSEEYGDNEELLKKEAVGKMIAKFIVNQHQESESNKTILAQLYNTFLRMLEKIKVLFRNADTNKLKQDIDSAFEYAASKILDKDISGLSDSNISGTTELYQKESVEPRKERDTVNIYIRNYTNSLNKAYRQLGDDPSKNKLIYIRIKELEAAIEKLREKRDVSLIIELSEKQLSEVESDIAKFDTLTVNEKMKSVQTALSYVASVMNLGEYVKLDIVSENAKIQSLVGRADNLHRQLIGIEANLLGEISNSDIVPATALQTSKDTMWATMEFLDASRSHVPLLSKIRKFIETHRFRAEEKIKAYDKSLDNLRKELDTYLSSKGMSYEQFLDVLEQKKADGTWSGDYVGKISQEYYDRLYDLRKTAKEASEKGDNTKWRAYYDFRVVNADKVVNEEAYKDALESVVEKYSDSSGNITDQLAIDYWINQYNPVKGTVSNNPYVKWEPKESLWSDPRYLDIKGDNGKYKNTPVERVYDALVALTDEGKGIMPRYILKGLKPNYLPEVGEKMANDLLKDGLTGLIKGMGSKIADAFTEQLSQSDRYAVEDETGRLENSIPIYMMNNKLKPENKSNDVFKVMRLFSSKMYLYQYKSIVEDPAKMVRHIIANTREEQNIRSNGTIREVTQGNKNTLKVLDGYINSMVYDNRKDPLKNGTLTAFRDKDGNLLPNQITVDKIGDNLIWWTQLLGLGFNMFSPVNNLLFGVSSNMIHAAGGEDFTESEAIKAFGMTLTTLGSGFNKDGNSAKLGLLYDYLQLHTNPADSSTTNSKVFNKIQKYMFIMMEKTEKFNQLQLMTAVLMHKKVDYIDPTTGESKTVSLLDAFEVKDNQLYWNEDKYGDNQYADFSDNKAFLNQHITDLSKRLHGNYDINSPINIKRVIWGRLLMVFRNWIPEGINNRFGDELFNESLGRTTKGRYRTLGGTESITGEKLGFRKMLVKLLTEMLRRISFSLIKSNQLNELSEVDQANMRKNAAELVFLMTTFMLGSLLTGLAAGGDDDKKKALAKYFISQGVRLEADVLFYFSPGASMNILRNALPPLTTLYNIWRIVPDMASFAVGNDTIPTGVYHGQSRLLRQIFKVNPLTNQPLRTLEFPKMSIQSISGRSGLL